ncbi:uncharacterized protein LOC131231356 isoform X2 [Magnolia sinica]|uniref:uncharacterized protein LOC131231356 isoform X2 n=1 Tax=Magnolia sinica TaxID=86752 RepID=UPI0026592EC4|nr:uncharacterized protein LOC131231356 isoform X2 [Magnolia sinica]
MGVPTSVRIIEAKMRLKALASVFILFSYSFELKLRAVLVVVTVASKKGCKPCNKETTFHLILLISENHDQGISCFCWSPRRYFLPNSLFTRSWRISSEIKATQGENATQVKSTCSSTFPIVKIPLQMDKEPQDNVLEPVTTRPNTISMEKGGGGEEDDDD